jgi:hypothetical protein
MTVEVDAGSSSVPDAKFGTRVLGSAMRSMSYRAPECSDAPSSCSIAAVQHLDGFRKERLRGLPVVEEILIGKLMPYQG